MGEARKFFERAQQANADYKACLAANARSAAEFFRQKAISLVAQGVVAAAREVNDEAKEKPSGPVNASLVSTAAHGGRR